MERKTKGQLAEINVLKHCAENGYEVYLPFFDNAKYDMLIVMDGQVKRTSVKYTSVKIESGKYKVDLRQQSRRSNNSMSVTNFTHEEFDLLAVFIGPENKVVLLDVKQIKGSTAAYVS